MRIFKTTLLSLLFLASPHIASAAALYILPATGNFDRGTEFNVDVKINSEGEGINAVQATINWPKSVLEFVASEKAGSAFNFWVQEPELSSDSSSLSFVGGTPKGISGDALQVLRVKFKVIGSGAAEISFSNTAITASDGKGTNVLSGAKGANIGVGAEVVIQPKAPAPKAEIAPQPVRVQREAVPAKNLPKKPELRIPLYSDQTKWQNALGEVVVLWDVPDDVLETATQLDHNPNTVPQKAEKELATGKKFEILEEGIWYVHVRSRNNIGWGPAAHYRVAIDIKPPLAFEIKLPEGESTDTPAPILQFKTSDALAGLKEYQIRIDGGETTSLPASEFQGSFTLPLQAPGSHRVVVRAIDQAENGIEDDVTLDIIPIPSPTFSFVTRELFSEENKGLILKGTAPLDTNVLLQVVHILKGGKEEIAAKGIAKTDAQRNWEFTFYESLRNGQYVVIAQSQDLRGALSFTVKSEGVLVKSQPIIQIGMLQLGKGGAVAFLLVVLVLGFGGGAWFYKKRQERLGSRIVFAESEVSKIFKLIMEDAETLSRALQAPGTTDDEYALKRLKDNLKKMESYIPKGP